MIEKMRLRQSERNSGKRRDTEKWEGRNINIVRKTKKRKKKRIRERNRRI